MKKLAVLDAQSAPENFLHCFESMCRDAGVASTVLECNGAADIVDGASDCDAAMCFFVPIDDKALRHLPRLKMVVRVGIGVDSLNLDDCTRHGVLACNTPDYGIEEVAVHSLALILALERNVVSYSRATRAGQWNPNPGREMRRLSQRVLGLVGFGRIARKLASLASPLGYAIVAFDPFVTEEESRAHGAAKVGKDELFARADVISVLAPATEETRHIVNEKSLALAKDGLLLVNTSRGSLVCIESVINALENGKVRGAAFDVLEEEPPGHRCRRLLQNHAVIVTPHIAYCSAESVRALNSMSVQTALDYLCKGEVRNLVNTAVLRSR